MENLIDLLTNTLPSRVFDGHRDNIGVKCMLDMIWGLVGVC